MWWNYQLNIALVFINNTVNIFFILIYIKLLLLITLIDILFMNRFIIKIFLVEVVNILVTVTTFLLLKY